MLKKPWRYGIKVLVLADARNSCLHNAYFHNENGSGDNGQNSNENIWNANPGCFETFGPNFQN
jgi:hypothetical protein